MQLVIPFASGLSEGCQAALSRLELPNLQGLLSRLKATQHNAGDEWSLSPPHERVLAQAAGWGAGDGLIPWAAQRAQLDGIDTGDLAWGMLTPTHWHVGTDHVTMLDPDTLELSSSDSRELMRAVEPLFHSQGWLLAWGAPTRWYVAHESLADLPTASIDRVIGRNPDVWMPSNAKAKDIKRLQSEVQMKWFDHTVNQRREVSEKLSINTVWLSGCGPRQVSQASAVAVADDLRGPMLRDDWEAWEAMWRYTDASVLAAALRRVQMGQDVTLTLCGERHAQRYEIPTLGLWHRLTHPRSRLSIKDALGAL